jgi:hypothetical protein
MLLPHQNVVSEKITRAPHAADSRGWTIGSEDTPFFAGDLLPPDLSYVNMGSGNVLMENEYYSVSLMN